MARRGLEPLTDDASELRARGVIGARFLTSGSTVRRSKYKRMNSSQPCTGGGVSSAHHLPIATHATTTAVVIVARPHTRTHPRARVHAAPPVPVGQRREVDQLVLRDDDVALLLYLLSSDALEIAGAVQHASGHLGKVGVCSGDPRLAGQNRVPAP